MKGYLIDSDSMQELWERITEIDLENINEIRDALGFTKGILYPIKLGNYVKIKPEREKEQSLAYTGQDTLQSAT